jgi:hypothetical protein
LHSIPNMELDNIFKQVGLEYNVNARAEYKPVKPFRTTWRRNSTGTDYTVTDYIRHAPADVKRDYARFIIQSSIGQKKGYSERFIDYLQTKEFLSYAQPLFIHRSRAITESPQGRFYDLEKLYDNLVDQGLVTRIDGVRLTWSTNDTFRMVGYTHIIFKLIVISGLLDRKEVPEFVPENILHHEILHNYQSLNLRRHHNKAFKMAEREHPKHKETNEFLRKYCGMARARANTKEIVLDIM